MAENAGKLERVADLLGGVLRRRHQRRQDADRLATVLLSMHHTPRDAWHDARARRDGARQAGITRSADQWRGVMAAIERRHGPQEQPDTATRMADR